MAEPVPFPSKPAAFRREGLGYVYEPPNTGVVFRVQRLKQESGGLRARITVETTLPGMAGHLYQGRHLLEGAGSMRELRKALEDISGEHSPLTPQWERLLRALTKAVVDTEEQGEPFETVGDLPETDAPPDQVQLLLPARRAVQLYGVGSGGKGWLATLIAVCVQLGIPLCGLEVQQGNVLYLDWEDDRETLDRRVKMVARGLDVAPPVFQYRSCKRGGRLENQIAEIAARVDSHAIALAIIDSVQMASGSVGEHGTYEDSAIRLMTAVSMMGTTTLLVDHLTDAGRRTEGLAGKSYGSIFKQNLCRLTWELKREQEMGSAISHIGLYMTKTNHTALLPPLGFQLDFSEAGAVKITREDVRDSPTLSGPLSIAFKLERAIQRDGSGTVGELAQAIGEKRDSVEKALRRRTDKFAQEREVVGSATPLRWGLLHR